MNIVSMALVLTAALASGSAWSHGGGSHGGGGFHSGGGFHGGGVHGSAGFHGGGHGGFHHFHGDHFHGHSGGFIGAPYFWPWYYPAPYYAPAYPYSDPPAYSYDPPPVAAPYSPSYAPPPVAAPGSADNPVVELPTVDTPKQSSSNAIARAPPSQLFMYPRQGQSAQQQTSDRDQCYQWALGQIGSDQVRLSPAQTNDYYRAMEACLDARGYAVR